MIHPSARVSVTRENRGMASRFTPRSRAPRAAILRRRRNIRHRVIATIGPYGTYVRTDVWTDGRTGVLTVFRLDRVERGPCQIPAS
jgi:hypothetical protein